MSLHRQSAVYSDIVGSRSNEGARLASLHRLICIVVLLGIAGLARAHPAPFSFLDLQLDAQRTHGALVIHDFDAAHELQLTDPAQLLDPSIVIRHQDALIAVLAARLQLRTTDGLVTPRWGNIEVLPERHSLRLPFTLDAAVRDKLEVATLLFPYDANHQTFVNLYEHGELAQQAILDAERQSLTVYRGTLQGLWAVVSTYVKAGVEHILIGPDHVLFVFGLMLLGGTWWRLATIVTAFTVGHSVTLSLATLGIVALSPRIVEPAIALSIIVVGVDNLLVNRQRGAAQGNITARDLRPWMAAVFGLVHGFGFASVLIEFGLPQAALGWSLAAFNLGVELGQLCIVLVLLSAGRLAAQLPSHRVAHAERFLTLASVAVIAAGVYWLVLRIGLVA